MKDRCEEHVQGPMKKDDMSKDNMSKDSMKK